jgi:type IV secretory pathway protease TraF
MLCPSCEFHNMPGSMVCARCGTSLKLATAEVDVHPPRAGRWERRLSGLSGWRRIWNRTRSALSEDLRHLLVPRTVISRPPSWWSLILPGLSQWQRGDRGFGRILLLAYLALLAGGLMSCGTFTGSTLLGFAFATHVAAISDAFGVRSQTLPDSFRLTVFIALLLGCVIYLPTGWAISRVATPLRITGVMPPFQTGDVVWYNRSFAPNVGDLVVYDLPRLSVNARTERGQAVRVDIVGLRINRVVALAGQQVEVQQQKLLVDGQVSPWQPVDSLALASWASTTIPDDHLLILPDHVVPMDLTNLPWEQLSVVPRHRVNGQVFFRSLPWNRISRIR